MEKLKKRAEYLMSVLALCGAMYLLSRVPSCGNTKPSEQVTYNPVTKSCGDVELGKTKISLCEDGKSKRVEACTENGLTTAIECPDVIGCSETSFADVKPIIEKKCLSCHAGFNDYQTAKKVGPKMVARVSSTNVSDRMPKNKDALPIEEIAVFKNWSAGGFIERCQNKPAPTNAHYNLNQLEDSLIADLNSLNLEDRSNSKYLIVTHKLNQDSPSTDMEAYIGGASKGVNSIAKKARRVIKLPSVGPEGSILRINLKDFQLSQADWNKITAAEPLKIISLTNRGKIIAGLAGDKQSWMHFDNFLDTVFRNSKLYYALMGTPVQIEQLFAQLEVNFFGDFLNFRAQLLGTNKSPITLNKNRLISRHDSLDGYLWLTYDVDNVAGKNKNLFETPLPVFAKGKGNPFAFQASEAIYSLPNGLQAYALFNGQGVRQDVAPLNVVTDVDSPVSPEIRAANSCHRCHSGGIIPAVDEIRDHVVLNASQFPAGDVDIVKVLYRDAKTNSDTFSKDNAVFAKSLVDSGIKPGLDPISVSTDRFLLNWNLEQTAAFFFIPKEEFVVLLNQSAVGRTQVGQLLSGGSITHDQFVAVLPVLIKDLRLFQEPLGG